MTDFINLVNEQHGKEFSSYGELYQWSIDNISNFWGIMFEYGDIKTSRGYDAVVGDLDKMPGAKWFSGARLNFAENLLRYRDGNTALVFKGESGEVTRMTFAELYDNTARLAKSLRNMGVTKGDRIAGFMPNIIETVIAMLATTSIGATWSSCSPDFGIKGVLDRFGQIQPKVLFTASGYSFRGKEFDSLERIANIIKDLPSIEKVVVVSYLKSNTDIANTSNSVLYKESLFVLHLFLQCLYISGMIRMMRNTLRLILRNTRTSGHTGTTSSLRITAGRSSTDVLMRLLILGEEDRDS